MNSITLGTVTGVQPGDVIEISGGTFTLPDDKPPWTFWTTRFHYYHLSWRPWFFKRQRRPFHRVVRVLSATTVEVQ